MTAVSTATADSSTQPSQRRHLQERDVSQLTVTATADSSTQPSQRRDLQERDVSQLQQTAAHSRHSGETCRRETCHRSQSQLRQTAAHSRHSGETCRRDSIALKFCTRCFLITSQYFTEGRSKNPTFIFYWHPSSCISNHLCSRGTCLQAGWHRAARWLSWPVRWPPVVGPVTDLRLSRMAMCSSEVPGGVSIRR